MEFGKRGMKPVFGFWCSGGNKGLHSKYFEDRTFRIASLLKYVKEVKDSKIFT